MRSQQVEMSLSRRVGGSEYDKAFENVLNQLSWTKRHHGLKKPACRLRMRQKVGECTWEILMKQPKWKQGDYLISFLPSCKRGSNTNPQNMETMKVWVGRNTRSSKQLQRESLVIGSGRIFQRQTASCKEKGHNWRSAAFSQCTAAWRRMVLTRSTTVWIECSATPFWWSAPVTLKLISVP